MGSYGFDEVCLLVMALMVAARRHAPESRRRKVRVPGRKVPTRPAPARSALRCRSTAQHGITRCRRWTCVGAVPRAPLRMLVES